MKRLTGKNYGLCRKLCLALVLLLLFNLFAVPTFATNGEELSDEMSDEITEDYVEDISEEISEECSEEDVSAANPPFNSGVLPGIEAEDNLVIGGDDAVSPNAIPTSSFNNDCIALSCTNLMVEMGETFDIRCVLKKPGYTIDFFDGGYLFDYSLEGEYLSITGVHPGDDGLMLYYSKRVGNNILDEGSVMLTIRVQPKAGYVLIKNMDSGRYIDVPGSKTANGTKINLWSRNQTMSPNQIWRILPQENGTVIITSALCSYGTNHLYFAHNSSTGYAELQNSYSPAYLIQYNVTQGYYTIKPSNGSPLYLATENNGTASGTHIKFVSSGSTTGTIEWDLNYNIEGLYGVPYIPPTSLNITSPTTSSYIKTYNTNINFAFSAVPSNTTATFKWKSSNSDILTINQTTGVAQAKKPGRVTVTVSTAANSLKDEITVDVYGKLNVAVYYDQAFATLCGNESINPSNFARALFSPVINKYAEDFHIDITVNGVYSYTSSGDECQNGNKVDSLCACVPPSVKYNLHKHPETLVEEFNPNNYSNYLKVLLTGHFTAVEGGRALGYIRSDLSKATVTINPKMYLEGQFIGEKSLKDDYFCMAVAHALAHELGHYYGVVDHYDKEDYELEDDQSHQCIWGKNHKQNEVFSELVMCTYCKNILKENGIIRN